MSENAPTRHGVDPPDSAAPGGDSAADHAADGEGHTSEELAPVEDRSPDEPAPVEDRSPEELARAERLEGLRETLRVEDGETLERAFLFEPLEREDVAFRLALVVKRIAPDRLEMVAIGARAVGTEAPVSDFVRRARFPGPPVDTRGVHRPLRRRGKRLSRALAGRGPLGGRRGGRPVHRVRRRALPVVSRRAPRS